MWAPGDVGRFCDDPQLRPGGRPQSRRRAPNGCSVAGGVRAGQVPVHADADEDGQRQEPDTKRHLAPEDFARPDALPPRRLDKVDMARWAPPDQPRQDQEGRERPGREDERERLTTCVMWRHWVTRVVLQAFSEARSGPSGTRDAGPGRAAWRSTDTPLPSARSRTSPIMPCSCASSSAEIASTSSALAASSAERIADHSASPAAARTGQSPSSGSCTKPSRRRRVTSRVHAVMCRTISQIVCRPGTGRDVASPASTPSSAERTDGPYQASPS